MPDIDDRYQLLEVIASGGMATVWRALDSRLQRHVAVKRPHPAAPGLPTHARLEREARAAAGLRHPNLVTIFDVGSDDEGPYLVMELVDGPTLADSSVAWDKAEAAAAAAQIADALAAVHAAGLVHRDVKPANVLISERGPLLTDFGIALDDTTGELTMTGTVVATPNYAAPEVLSGQGATPASDIFSLGALLYRLASGSQPFEGTDRTPPPELGEPGLDHWIRRCLASDPADRPTAQELSKGIRAGAPTSAIPVVEDTVPMPEATAPIGGGSPAEPDRSRQVTENRSRSAGGALLAAAIGVAALALLGLGLSGDDPPVAAVAETTTAPQSTSISTTAPATTATTLPATTTSPPAPSVLIVDGEVLAAREKLLNEFEKAANRDLNPAETRELMDRVDEAIALSETDRDATRELILEVAESIDSHLDGKEQDKAIDALIELARRLGLEVENDDEDD